MTIYEKQLARAVGTRYGRLTSGQVVERLVRIGVVDPTLCKVLAVREYVAGRQRTGESKTDAMWQASERFSCSYEYVRKCMYYYTDINLAEAAKRSETVETVR